MAKQPVANAALSATAAVTVRHRGRWHAEKWPKARARLRRRKSTHRPEKIEFSAIRAIWEVLEGPKSLATLSANATAHGTA